MSKFIDLTGQTFNGFKIIEELHNNRVIVKCEECEKTFECTKSSLKINEVACKNRECIKNVRWKRIDNLTEKEFREIKVIKEMGSSRVKVKCLKCNTIFECDKSLVKSNLVSCTNLKCMNNKYRKQRINLEGQKIGKFLVIEELGKGRLLVQCIDCKITFECARRSLKINKVGCQNKKCSNNSKNKIRKRVDGKELGNIRVMQELENRNLLVECRCCHKSFKCNKQAFNKEVITCKNKECINSIGKKGYLRNADDFIISTAIKTEENEVLFNFTCKQCGFNDYLTKEQCIKHLQGHKERE